MNRNPFSDRRNYSITLFPDVPNIIRDIVERGIKIAIVSSNSSKDLDVNPFRSSGSCTSTNNISIDATGLSGITRLTVQAIDWNQSFHL